jgi:16S rRNA (cytidine1402-2'-O)-methyltransferase
MLTLIPSSLQEEANAAYAAPIALERLSCADVLIVENLRTARRFIRALLPLQNLDAYTWIAYDKHEGFFPLPECEAAFKAGKMVALLSDAGYPAIGDPGADIVALAHRLLIRVEVLPGSCSFLLALAASGLGGQRFAFNGYLPVKGPERGIAIKEMEANSARYNQTQIVMDTPYRNQATLADLLANLLNDTALCLALDLQGVNEQIVTRKVGQWKKQLTQHPAEAELPKVPAVFVFRAVKK